jgi:hypothetical protein
MAQAVTVNDFDNAEQLRSEQNEAREEKRKKLLDKISSGIGDDKKQAISNMMAPAQMGTSKALMWAWGCLIPSWGISLLYIDLHVFLRYVIGEQFFCKLGHEWIPKKTAGAVAGEAAESVGKMAGTFEVMGVLLLNFIALVIILNFLGISYFIIDFYSSNIIEQVYKIIKALGMIV